MKEKTGYGLVTILCIIATVIGYKLPNDIAFTLGLTFLIVSSIGLGFNLKKTKR